MYLSRILPALALAMCAAASPAKSSTSQPRALVYRGQSACKGCSEAVARLLEKSPQKFTVTYVGRDEDNQITAELLSQAAVYAQPGGPDLDQAYKELQPHQAQLRTFVENGGRYLGFCLGAFLAGSTPGFRLLPPGANATPERKAPDAQVTGQEDTMIQVDWTFRSSTSRGTSNSQNGGAGAGETAARRWLYFQDGAVITGLPRDDGNMTVLGRYSSNGNVAASLTPLGRGVVALVGPHPEATPDWYRAYRLENPDGIHYDIGFDFINAAMDAAPLPTGTGGTSTSTSTSTSTPGAADPTSSAESSWHASDRGRGRMTLQNPIGLIIQTLKSLWVDIF
ncbi:hypothetical protein E4U31_004978 [Claviceps sp. LM219 group G6]|nr:hypothetical protein E4U15_006080 [Claviceps sp. LM218 group G6]KAG6111077.1 hypothetical protein E4U31_004978 [Claviceps sp. LM219 group G6]